MALDIPAVPITAQTIRYAKAAWDFDRDGAAPDYVKIPSQPVPTGSLIVGYGWQTIAPLSTDPLGGFYLEVGPHFDSATFTPNSQANGLVWLSGISVPVLEGSFPITLGVIPDAPTAGSMLLYVFYV